MALLRALNGTIEENGIACIAFALPSTLETLSARGFLKVALHCRFSLRQSENSDKIRSLRLFYASDRWCNLLTCLAPQPYRNALALELGEI